MNILLTHLFLLHDWKDVANAKNLKLSICHCSLHSNISSRSFLIFFIFQIQKVLTPTLEAQMYT